MEMIIMRGLPGSGKSTKVKELLERNPGMVVCSADDYFMKDGVYTFNARQIGKAHEACFKKAMDAVLNGKMVVIDNTNTQKWEYERYQKLGEANHYWVSFIEMPHEDPEILAKRNTHGVPLESIKKMLNRWQNR